MFQQHGGGWMKSVDRFRRYIHRILFLQVVAAVAMLAGPAVLVAAEADLEKDLQVSLEKSRLAASAAVQKLALGKDSSQEINQLKTLSENVRIAHLLLQERFALRQEKASGLGTKALERQQAMAAGYKAALTEYLSLIDSLPSAVNGQQSAVSKLKELLEKLLPKKKRPIIGSLPYKHLNLPAIEPTSAPAITPAYKGGNKNVSPDDTAATPEAPISREIAALAQSLSWNPVSIYEYVKNNVETEWYWGCMKGAEDTLHQKSGNDCDQATLLTALLRASGYPTRYVRGVIAFFPDIERAKNLTGIDDAAKIAEFLQKAGIPSKPVIVGGTIANFQLEHIWVETQVPYSNYRGSIIDEHGKAWLGLDTSIKVKGYEYDQPKDIFELSTLSGQLTAIRDEYLGLVQSDPTFSIPAPMTVTPLDYFKAKLSAVSVQQDPLLTADNYKLTRTLLPETMNILPASMQFTQVKVTNEYTAIPDELRHKVKLSAVSNQLSASGGKLLETTLDVLKLSNQQITLSYEPETVQDQEIINSFGGLDSTPAYLVRLRPVLKVNGERIAVATDGLPMGVDYDLSIELISPNSTEKINNTIIVGNLSIVGIVAQKSVSPQQSADSTQLTAEGLLYREAINYIDRWNTAEDELASLLHLSISRPFPTVVTIGGVIDVTYLLDMPHGFTWKGVSVDADLRRIEAVSAQQSADSSGRVKLFMQLSGLQGSILENRIFEDDFKVESISTAKLIQISGQQTSVNSQLFTIDKTNIDAALPILDLDDNIKEDIRNSVNQNMVVRLPQADGLPLTAITYHDWSGIGYIKENPETGESGWMLSGMIAGGSTVDAEWLNNLYRQQTLSTPYAGATNHDPLAGVRLFKIPATDKQDPKTVGTALSTPFAAAVLDGKDLPVVGATVSFRIVAGGGTIQCLNQTGGPSGPPSETSCEAPTSNAGIARAFLTLGKETKANADYMKLDASDDNYTQIGLNLVTASAQSHSGAIALNSPFEAYGKPDVPTKIVKVYPLNNVYVLVNNPGGTLHSRVTDTHGNPVSNVPLIFTVQDAVSNNSTTDPLPTGYRNLELYTRETCANPYPIAGDCATTPTLPLKTHYYGAQVDTILGNTLNTHYTVRVSAAGLEAVTFDLYSQGTRGSANAYIPSVLMVWSLGIVNEKGESVNAAQAGTELKAPLTAKMFLLQDEYDLRSEQCTKSDSSGNTVTFTGHSLVSKGTFTIKSINNGTVSFTPKEGGGTPLPTQNLGNGQYQATYKTGSVAAKNIIEADGSAAVTVPETWRKTRCLETSVINDRTVTLQHGQYAVFDQTTHELIPEYATSMKPTYTAYGVNTDLTIQPSIVLLNDQGYTTADTTLTYTIQPGDYRALRVDLDAYSAGQNTTETWEGYVVADATQGQGTVVFVAGTPFDIAKLHKEQVVLNRGTDMEIKGEKKDIPVAQIRVLTDESTPKEADEIKFGDGSKANKRYKLEMKSVVLQQACNNGVGGMNGTIRSVTSSGQTVTVSGSGYYAATYNLDFTPGNGNCILGIKDSPLLKDKFIVSNMSTATLDARVAELQGQNIAVDLNTISVLYGGLGSKLQLTINGTSKAIPIEPVGIIVLGIDGLRQDVLYKYTDDASNEASYNDPNGCGQNANCYVPVSKTTLPGLSQIMTSEGTLKLKNVTAIFPSITFASWASIFSGKTPTETGITGNEFFARDLYNAAAPQNMIIPGSSALPSGMVTLDADGGALRPAVSGGFTNWILRRMSLSAPFALRHVMPAEFLGYETLSKKRNSSAPGKTLIANPIWQETNDKVATKYQVDTSQEPGRCDKSIYECRTVSMFNQYVKGVDWWGTPSFKWKTLWEITAGDPMFDTAVANETVDFITDYFKQRSPNGKQKRFPAIFSVYLPGLDHEAHVNGMSNYKKFVQNTVDVKIGEIVKALKDQDEFYNKLFIIVSDHGETQMPEKMLNPDTNQMENVYGDCTLDTDMKSNKKQLKEKNFNNNLHIWELANLFAQFPDPNVPVRVLVPEQVASLKDLAGVVTNKVNGANVIAAMNGPMAHIYIRGTDWQSDPDKATMDSVIVRLYSVLKTGTSATGTIGKQINDYFPRLGTSVANILARWTRDGDYSIVSEISEDSAGNVTFTIDTPASLGGLEYQKAYGRITGMNNKDRSGDIILLMKDSTLGDATDRYSTAYACKSWHGSLNASDSYVAFIVSYPGGNKSEIDPFLTTACPSNSCDGNWKLTDLIKEINNKQYPEQ
jgi:hypothetical protein